MTYEVRKQALQFVVVAGLGAAILSLGTLLWSTWRSGEQEIADSLQILGQLKSIAAFAKSWKPKELANDARAQSLFLPEAASTIVEANLLASIKEMVTQQTIDISRTSSSPSRSQDGILWHDVTIDVAGTSAALLQFIKTLEAATPALFVERVQMQSNVQPGVVLQQEPVLSAELTISGATRTPTTVTAANPP